MIQSNACGSHLSANSRSSPRLRSSSRAIVRRRAAQRRIDSLPMERLLIHLAREIEQQRKVAAHALPIAGALGAHRARQLRPYVALAEQRVERARMFGLARRERAQRAGDIRVGAKLGVTREAVREFLMAAGDVGQFGEQPLLRRTCGPHSLQYSHQTHVSYGVPRRCRRMIHAENAQRIRHASF